MAEKEVFCLLLWVNQGGKVNSKRVPLAGSSASGYCDRPTDCYSCPLMQKEMVSHPSGYVNWVCPSCLREVAKKAKTKGNNIHITGHYNEGICQYVGCTRPTRYELGDDNEFVKFPERFSRFLQLVIGDINSQ